MKEILKNKKVIITLTVIALILAVVVFIRRKRKADEVHTSVADGTASSVASAQMPVASFPLTPYSRAGEYSAGAGSYGQQIASLQQKCNDKYGAGLDVDGKLGPKTEAAFNSCFGSALISEADYKSLS